jgi:hypothetical protein
MPANSCSWITPPEQYAHAGQAKAWAIMIARAGMAESVDAADSKSAALKSVWVRVPLPAPRHGEHGIQQLDQIGRTIPRRRSAPQLIQAASANTPCVAARAIENLAIRIHLPALLHTQRKSGRQIDRPLKGIAGRSPCHNRTLIEVRTSLAFGAIATCGGFALLDRGFFCLAFGTHVGDSTPSTSACCYGAPAGFPLRWSWLRRTSICAPIGIRPHRRTAFPSCIAAADRKKAIGAAAFGLH